MISLTMMPARQGDALWITWEEDGERCRMLVDTGTPEVGPSLRARIMDLAPDQRRFELLVITHVDNDHIGGALTGLVEGGPIPGLAFGDIWFNGWPHLHGQKVPARDTVRRTAVESYGPVEGEKLSTWLMTQPWNETFDRGPIVWGQETAAPVITLNGGLEVTVLGPTPQRLANFIPTWRREIERALKTGRLDDVPAGLEAYGATAPPVLENDEDLRRLAEQRTGTDRKAANGSSIVLLLTFRGRRLLMAGDAWAHDLVAALAALGEGAPDLDLVVLPHHGSAGNVTAELVAAVDCPLWLISTDGTGHKHPHPASIARVICHSRRRPPTLGFNVPSDANSFWTDGEPDWADQYAYRYRVGGVDEGLTIELEARL